MRPVALLIAALFIQAPEGSILGGRLFSPDAIPAAGTRVAILSTADLSLVASTATDSLGKYRLNNVPAGKYFLAAGPIERPTYYPGTANIGLATEITVSAIEFIEIANFALARDYSGGRRSQLEVKVTGLITIDMNQDSQDAYETLAHMAGVNVVFATRFMSEPAEPFHVENVDIYRAFDLLSTKTFSFWEPLDNKTIFVGPSFFGKQTVEAQLQLRDALAVVGVSQPNQLRPTIAGPYSFNIHQDSRKAFGALGKLAGINVIFAPGFQSQTAHLKLDNVDISKALDILSLQDSKVWVPYNDQTIVVVEDEPAIRRDFGLQTVKAIRLGNATTPQRTSDILTTLRSTYAFKYAAPFRNFIVIRDTPAKVALAAKVIADLDRSSPRPPETGAGELFISESGFVRNPRPEQSELQVSSTGPVSITMTEDARRSYELLARTAGIQVVFDRRFIPGVPTEFHVENVEFLDALNLLSLQTGNFWQVSDNKTILVAPDIPQIRKELERQTSKTISLKNVASPQETVGIANVLRAVLGVTDISTDQAAIAIVVRDTPPRLGLIQKLIQDLTTP